MNPVPWYAVQILTGHETDMITACRKYIHEGEEVFQFLAARQYRNPDGWVTKDERLFPGYLFLATDDVEDLFFRLKKIPSLTKIVRSGWEFAPIEREEQEFLFSCGGEKHVIPVSRGFKDGERVIITEGPLAGWPGRIVRLNRHKRTAVVEVRIFHRMQQVTFSVSILKGEGIFPRKERPEEKAEAAPKGE